MLNKNVMTVFFFDICKNCERILFVELATKTNDYITNHFEEVVTQSPDFRHLSLASLKKLLSRDELNVSSEEKVFEAVVAWMEANPSQRRQHIVDLLTCIRLGMLSNHYVVERVKVL